MASIKKSEQLARINPDSKVVLFLVLGVTTVIAVVAFAVSFAGLAAVSSWAQIPPWLSWGLPVFIDGAILGFTIMILVFRARGEPTVFAWVVLIAFTVISVGANAAHAYAEGNPEDWRTIVGSGLAGLAPAGLAVFIHGIAKLLVAPPLAIREGLDGNIEASGLARSRSSDSDLGEERTSVSTDPPQPSQAGTQQRREHNESKPSVVTPESTESPESRAVGQDISPGTSDGEREVSQESPSEDELAIANLPREEQMEYALLLSSQGNSHVEIGKLLGVSRATVGRWIRASMEPTNHH